MVPKFVSKIYVEWINPDRIRRLGENKVNNGQNRRRNSDEQDEIWRPKTFKKDLNDKGSKVVEKLAQKDAQGTKQASDLSRIDDQKKSMNQLVSQTQIIFGTLNQR